MAHPLEVRVRLCVRANRDSIPIATQQSARSLPEGARGRGQRGAKGPDVVLVLLHCGNGDFERGDVGQQGARCRRGVLLLPLQLGLQERHKLDLYHRAGEPEHTPERAHGGGVDDRDV